MKPSAQPRSSTSSAKTKAAKQDAHATRTVHESAASADTAKPRNEEERHALIAQAAYFRAEKRGFASGRELDDWLAAESEIDGQPLLAHQLAHSDT